MKIALKTITGKLTLATLLISICGMLLVFCLTYFTATKIILTQTIDKQVQTAAYQAEKVSNFFNEQVTIIRTLKDAFTVLGEDIDSYTALCETVYQNNPQLEDIYVGFSDGAAYFVTYTPDEDYTATTRPWYTGAMESKEEVLITKPFLMAGTTETIIAFSQYAGKIKNTDAVVVLDVYVDIVLDMGQIEVPTGAYAFIGDKDGNIITHSNPQFLPSNDTFVSMNDIPSYQNLAGHIIDGAVTSKAKDYDDVNRYFITQKIEGTDWYFFLAVPESLIFSAVNRSIPLIAGSSFLIMVLAAVVLSILIRKMIVKRLTALSQYATHIAKGELDMEMPDQYANGRDEISAVMRDFRKASDTILRMINDIKIMSEQHQNSQFDAFLNETSYEGAYGEVAKRINFMVSMYVDNFMEITRLLNHFEAGDFKTPAKQFPGKMAASNQTIENFRGNLISISYEIHRLEQAALSGKLSYRADISKANGDWKKILSGLNQLMDAVVTPIHEASDVLTKVSQGNLNVKVTGDYQGDFAIVKHALNNTIDQLAGYIHEISTALSSIAKNHLDFEITSPFSGEFSAIKDSINQILSTQNQILGDLIQVIQQVYQGAEQVSQSSSYLAEGVQKQNESLEELKTFIDVVHSKSTQNTQKAETAETLSEDSKNFAFKGNQEMQEMVLAMDSIKEASAQIGDVMKIINGISFQTNLLSLNAAVEAARAGAHGKGFAIVAEEVKNLAARSNEAAQETQSLVENTTSRIEKGIQIVNATALALENIVSNVDNVSDIISVISETSQEQAQSVSEISNHVDTISDVVNNISATSEQSATIAEELRAQSSALNNLVSNFRLKNH